MQPAIAAQQYRLRRDGIAVIKGSMLGIPDGPARITMLNAAILTPFIQTAPDSSLLLALFDRSPTDGAHCRPQQQ